MTSSNFYCGACCFREDMAKFKKIAWRVQIDYFYVPGKNFRKTDHENITTRWQQKFGNRRRRVMGHQHVVATAVKSDKKPRSNSKNLWNYDNSRFSISVLDKPPRTTKTSGIVHINIIILIFCISRYFYSLQSLQSVTDLPMFSLEGGLLLMLLPWYMHWI